MRCLTLADALAAQGAVCQFICREHEGNLLELIRSKGYTAHALRIQHGSVGASLLASRADYETQTAHSHWLGASQTDDAAACTQIIAEQHPDWLIVDHYALDACWEQALKPYYNRLMVIDDLADRPHISNVLLDQTFGRKPEDYSTFVPVGCQLLCGSQYALLRPEFSNLRPYSLQRRTKPQLRQLLITMGGVDKDNATGQVLEALRSCALPADCRITVVMGATAPWLKEVERLAQNMPWPTRVKVGVGDMAQLMADSDLAIGAAGATTWERCCLGLPTIMVVLADNQHQVAQGLEQAGAAYVIESIHSIGRHLPNRLTPLIESPMLLRAMSQSASDIVDVHGIDNVVQHLEF